MAVLKVPVNLPVLPLGDSDSSRPGDKIVAIGHPLGLGNTVSDGLVSAIRRVSPQLVLLQISAPISPPPRECTITDATLTWGFKESFRAYDREQRGKIKHDEDVEAEHRRAIAAQFHPDDGRR